MANEQKQQVEFLVQAKYRGNTYPAGADVDVLPADVDSLIKDGVIDADTEAEEIGEKPIEKQSVAELKSYAELNGIDLGDASKKPEILAAIKAAQNPGGGDPNGGAAGGNQ